MNNWQRFYELHTSLYSWKGEYIRGRGAKNRPKFLHWLENKIYKSSFIPDSHSNYIINWPIVRYSLDFHDAKIWGWAAPDFKDNPCFALELSVSQYDKEEEEKHVKSYEINLIPAKFLDSYDEEDFENWWQEKISRYKDGLKKRIKKLNVLLEKF